MQRIRPFVWLQVTALLFVVGCHPVEPEGLETIVFRKISIADKFYDVAAIDAEHAVIVGYGGKILRTESGGRSWEIIPSGVTETLYSIEFVDTERGWAAGQNGVILHTTDGGRSWKPQANDATVYLFALDFVNEREGWVVGDRATYLHTADGGENWQLGKIASDEGLSADEALLAQDPVLYDVKFVDANTGWIVGELGNIYHTTDRGKSWATQQASLLGGGIIELLDLPTFFGVEFTDANNGVVAGLEGKVARTRDGGASWKFETFAGDRPFSDPLFEPFLFPDGSGWVVGAAGEVARQENPSEPWRKASLGMEILTWLRGVDFFDEQNGWIVGGYGLILHTTDGGESWLPSLG